MLKDLKNFSLPEVEEKVLEFWKKNNIFEKSLTQRQAQKAKTFRFFEGPPSANGLPHIAHVLTRSFKDIILRYKAMRGFYVPRKAGWDTHGLPIEIAVEKELGIKNKSEIEKFGIANFNNRARLLVWKHKNEWEKLTERIGFWLDFNKPYITYDNKYIESLWWIFKRISSAGFLKKMYKVVAWCSRCQTPLSNHELAQPDVYQKVDDPSVYVKFKIKNKKSKSKNKEYFLVWTTTPWTLPANVAIAVDPKLTYTKFRVGDEFFWSYNVPPKIGDREITVVEKIAGNKLVGKIYEPLYKIKKQKAKSKNDKNLYQVLAGDFILTTEGTGLVHIAPAFGEEDWNLWRNVNPEATAEIPVTIDDQGRVTNGLPGAGKFIKDADKDIIADLESRGLMYQHGTVNHEYPFCWRCSMPLIYFARTTWFIEMSRLRQKLLSANAKINWIPDHIKNGRFGEWLKDAKDWSISRDRYWGTPLPIWECAKCGQHEVIGGLEELRHRVAPRNTFYFLRHGEATHNIDNRLAGQDTKNYTSVLTAIGKKQVQESISELKRANIDLVFSSTLKRAKETAAIVKKATSAPVKYSVELVDINGGALEGHSGLEYDTFFKTRLDKFTHAPFNGETLNDVKRRMANFVGKLDQEYAGKHIIIVSHEDSLWALRSATEGLSDAAALNLPAPALGKFYEIDFGGLPLDQNGNLDVHRPYIDGLVLSCGKCRKPMNRVKEVADVWFDSGSMPLAQWHYPFENKALIDKKQQFPADYIVEGMDQTRGWFYTLLAVATLLDLDAPYHNVISLGLISDKFGQKMSKSKGNVVDPWPVVKKYGADVVRWYFYTINDPGDPKRFDEADLLKAYRKFHALVYNSFVFLKTYAGDRLPNATDFNIGSLKNILDRWIVSRWQEALLAMTKKLDNYEIGQATRFLEEFVDDLSHWYIRRSRRRFSEPQNPADFQSAVATLHYVLLELNKALAPFCPFFSEALYRALSNDSSGNNSVHLQDWAKADKNAIDKALIAGVAEARKLASEALALRAAAGIKVRQPLAAIKIKDKRLKIKDNEALLEMIKDEVNVKEIIFGVKLADGKKIELDTAITPELYQEGLMRELVRMIQKLRQDAGYKIADQIEIYFQAAPEITNVIGQNQDAFKKMLKAKQVHFHKIGEPFTVTLDAELETKLNEQAIVVGVRKA